MKFGEEIYAQQSKAKIVFKKIQHKIANFKINFTCFMYM